MTLADSFNRSPLAGEQQKRGLLNPKLMREGLKQILHKKIPHYCGGLLEGACRNLLFIIGFLVENDLLSITYDDDIWYFPQFFEEKF